jgi:hypothetical protein
MTEEVQNNPEPIKPNIYDQTTFAVEIQSVKTTTVGNLQRVVHLIKWILVGTYNGQSAGLDRVTEFQDDELQNIQNFVPYENLAKEVVIGWIESRTPMLHLKYTICNQMAAMQTSTTEEPSLPWSN